MNQYIDYKNRYLNLLEKYRIISNTGGGGSDVCEIDLHRIRDIEQFQLPELILDNFQKNGRLISALIPKYLSYKGRDRQFYLDKKISNGAYGDVYTYRDGEDMVALKSGNLSHDVEGLKGVGNDCGLVRSHHLSFYVLKLTESSASAAASDDVKSNRTHMFSSDDLIAINGNKWKKESVDRGIITYSSNDMHLHFTDNRKSQEAMCKIHRFDQKCNDYRQRFAGADGDMIRYDLMVMEFMSGSLKDLKPYLVDNLRQTINLMLQILKHIKCVEDKGWKYTDIKPDNFLYTCVDGMITVNIGDLGGLCRVDEEMDCQSSIVVDKEGDDYTIWAMIVTFFMLYLTDDVGMLLSGRRGSVGEDKIKSAYHALEMKLNRLIGDSIKDFFGDKIDDIDTGTVKPLDILKNMHDIVNLTDELDEFVRKRVGVEVNMLSRLNRFRDMMQNGSKLDELKGMLESFLKSPGSLAELATKSADSSSLPPIHQNQK